MELQRDPHLGVTVVGSSSQVTLPTAVTVGADPVSMVSLGLSRATGNANASAITTVVSTHLDLVSAQAQSMPQSSTPQAGTLNITAPCTPQLQHPDQLQHDQQQDLLDLASSGPGQGTHLDSNQTADLIGGNSSGQLDQTEWQDATFQAADSNSPKQTFVPCKVCGDKASGYHYGVTSCEGCKGFFRRSIQKQIEYRCLRDGKCLVIRLNRNRCQYCRFKKCLAVGMSRDSVRYGRVPKRSKSTDEQRVTTTDSSQEQTALESKQLAIYDIILTISQAHHANSVFTEDKIKALNRKSFSLVPKTEPGLSATCTEDALETQRLLTFQNLAVLITPTIQRVVEFAKRVPGFHDLSQDDQLILIKAGFFEIWLTRITRMFNLQESTLTFGDGSVIPKEHLEVVYPLELVSAMFDFASSFAQLHLNDTEVGLFTAVVLAAADRPGLTDMKGVERIQDKLIEALKLQISRNHSTEPHLFANILMKLPELRTLGTKHADNLQWFRQQWPRLRLPPLFAEIYDIPKTEEDLQS